MVARFHYDDAIYERLLADKLPPSERTDVTRHVETCDLCQAKLETLAEAGIDWQDVRRYLDRTGSSKAVNDEPTVDGGGEMKNLGVEFLTPSEMPHSLGRFGRYEIMEILGRGGMGIVMRGYDPALDRHSAIKVLAPELAASAAARGRFSREAKSAAAVVHEHVVPIQTVDQENGLPYLVMPVLEGKSLEQRVRQQGILTVTETLRIGRQIALGLAAAHAQGLVHRDVKPANILLHNGVERVVITDFGLARAIDDASLTQSGTIVGTPQYMSPEQAKGEHVDARGDLFSLGSVLYFMLSGHSPFRAETTMGVLHRIVNDTPRPLRQINAEVFPWLEQIITRLLAKDPADRYATAAEVAELLGQWLAHLQDPTSEPRPTQPTEEPQPSSSGGWSRTKKVALGLLGGAAVLLAGIFVVLETGKGTLTIESDQDDITVRITQGEAVARQLKVTPGENIVRLAAGRYLVEIEGEHDGLTVENDRVTLARGDVEVVRIVQRTEVKSGFDFNALPTELTEEHILALEKNILEGRAKLAGQVTLLVGDTGRLKPGEMSPNQTRFNVWFRGKHDLRIDEETYSGFQRQINHRVFTQAEQIQTLSGDPPEVRVNKRSNPDSRQVGAVADARLLGLVNWDTSTLGQFRPFFLDENRENLRGTRSEFEGKPIVKVSYDRAIPSRPKTEYWLSLEEGGLPIRIVVSFDDVRSPKQFELTLDVELQQVEPGIWYPANVRFRHASDGVVTRDQTTIVESANFRDPLDDVIFTREGLGRQFSAGPIDSSDGAKGGGRDTPEVQDSPPDSADAMNDRLRGEWKSTGEIELPTAIRDKLGLRTPVRMYIGQRDFWLMRGPAKWSGNDMSYQRDHYGNLRIDPEETGDWSRIQLELFENQRMIVTLEGTCQVQGDRLTLEFTAAKQPLFYEKERVLNFPLRWEFVRNRHLPPLRAGGLAVFSDYPTPKFPSPQELATEVEDFELVPQDDSLPDSLYELQGVWTEVRRYVGSPEGYVPIDGPWIPKVLRIRNGRFKSEWMTREANLLGPRGSDFQQMLGRLAVEPSQEDGLGVVTFASYKLVDQFNAPDGVVIDKSFSCDYQRTGGRLILDVVRSDRRPGFVDQVPERWEFVQSGDGPGPRAKDSATPLEGYWTATSEIGTGPWQMADELASLRLGIHGHLFSLAHVDAGQEIQHQTHGNLTPIKSDQDGSGEMEVDFHFHKGDPGKALRFAYRVEGDRLTIEVLASDPPDLYGDTERRSWRFVRGIKVPDLLEKGEIGYGERSVVMEAFSAVAAREENVFAVYSRKHQAWHRYRFAEGLKFKEVVDQYYRLSQSVYRAESILGFHLTGKPVQELVGVDIDGRFQTLAVDTPIDEELVVVPFGGGMLYYAANEHVYAFSGITGTWDALKVPGLPSATADGETIQSPIKNYATRPGIVVTLPEEVAIFAAETGKWERLSHDQAKEDPRFEDFNHDLKLFEPDYADPPPEAQGVTDTRSLEEAIKAFNQQHANHPIGKDQPPLTDHEVIASILWAGQQTLHGETRSEVPDLLSKKVLARQMPPGWRIEIETEFPGVDGERFKGWEIRLVSSDSEGKEVSHQVRRRLLHRVDDEGRPLPLPEPGEAEPDAVPLAEAIAKLNRQLAAQEGRQQPPLTEEEVIAAILLSKTDVFHLKSERGISLVSDQDFATFQRIAETRQLPTYMKLDIQTEYHLEEDANFLTWTIGISTPHPTEIHPRATISYIIRQRLLPWEPSPDHEVEREPIPDTRSLEEAIQAFNDTHANHPIGKDQPPLTKDELVASILWAGRDLAMPNAASDDVDRLHQMVVDRSLPSDWRFVIETQFEGVDGERFRGWEIRLFRHGAGGDEFSHQVRRRLLYAIDESGKPLALPQRGEAEPDAMPLAAAIAAFNGRHRMLDGRPQPPLTEEEVVAAILHWKTRRDEVPLMNQDFETFQRIAETRQLPAGMELELLPEFGSGDGSRFFIWSVRIKAPQSAKTGWTYAYEIRKQFVRWEPSPDHEIQWGPVSENGMQAGVRFQPGGDQYPMGTKVRLRFFYRSTSDRMEGVAFPRLMPRAYYDRIIAVDDQGEAITLDHDPELGGPVGWIQRPFGFGAEHEIGGLPIVLGDAERDKAETVIKAQVGQTVHLRFVLPNYADKTAPPLETGEVVFTLTEPEMKVPQQLTP